MRQGETRNRILFIRRPQALSDSLRTASAEGEPARLLRLSPSISAKPCRGNSGPQPCGLRCQPRSTTCSSKSQLRKQRGLHHPSGPAPIRQIKIQDFARPVRISVDAEMSTANPMQFCQRPAPGCAASKGVALDRYKDATGTACAATARLRAARMATRSEAHSK
jgi:hypothetical protein